MLSKLVGQNRIKGEVKVNFPPNPSALSILDTLGAWLLLITDTVFVCSSLPVLSCETDFLVGGYQLSSSSRAGMLMCHHKMFAGMHFRNTVGQNEWELMLLAALE